MHESSRLLATTEAISVYREALRRDAPAAELARLAESLDPETARWLDRFRASQREPLRLDAAFVRRLDGIVATAPGPTPTAAAPADLPPLLLTHPHSGSGWSEAGLPPVPASQEVSAPLPMVWFQTVSKLTAAVLLVVLIAGAVVAVLYPMRLHLAGSLAIFEPVRTIPAPPGTTGEAVLLDLTIRDFPTMQTFGGMTITDMPPGGGTRERTQDSTSVYYIAAGQIQITAEEAPVRVKIIPPGASQSDAEGLLSEGQTMSLATGTTVISSPQSVLDLVNTGTIPARMLGLIMSTGSENSERDGTTWRWGSVGLPQDLAGAVSIQLRQLTLNPGAALPIPEESRFDYSAAVFDVERARDLRFTGDGKWRNDSIVPLRTYLLRISSPPNAPAEPAG